MQAVCLHVKDEIEAVLRRNPFVHLYALGDLDDFFWQHTTWYGLRQNEQIQHVVLLYSGTSVPTLLAFNEEPVALMPMLLRSILPLLPRQVYAHLSPDVIPVFAEDYHVQQHGLHYKMALTRPTHLSGIDISEAALLSAADLDDLTALYQASYPGNWFDPRMLETGHYYGIRRGDRLVSVAGVHVYSRHYRVAALGNVTTHPELRGQGLGTRVCAKLCHALLETVDHVGLNVKADNASALACYERLGFERVAVYDECMLTLQQRAPTVA
ncbi:MAG TPA: GNAT family N-acetyltransferase [Herpetosiphonaceae bacterium]